MINSQALGIACEFLFWGGVNSGNGTMNACELNIMQDIQGFLEETMLV